MDTDKNVRMEEYTRAIEDLQKRVRVLEKQLLDHRIYTGEQLVAVGKISIRHLKWHMDKLKKQYGKPTARRAKTDGNRT